MVFPCLLADLQRRRNLFHVVLAPHSAGRGVPRRHAGLREVRADARTSTRSATTWTAPGCTIPASSASVRPPTTRCWSIWASRKPARRRSTRARTPSSMPCSRRMPAPGKQDLNNTGAASLQQYLLQKDPLHLGTDAEPALLRPSPSRSRISATRSAAEF